MTRSMWQAAVMALPAALLVSGCSGEREMSFSQDVQPVLQQYCAECHVKGEEGYEESQFLVASHGDVMKGTKFGPVVVAGHPESSSLYRLISGKADPSIQMPFHDATLPEPEQLVIEQWIEQGAKDN